MQHITGTAYGLVMRQGIARGLAGTRSRGTKVASAPLIGEEDDGPERSPTVGGENRPKGISLEKDGAAKPRQFGHMEVRKLNHSGSKTRGFAYVVHLNHAARTMQARKNADTAPFLTCIIGGKR